MCASVESVVSSMAGLRLRDWLYTACGDSRGCGKLLSPQVWKNCLMATRPEFLILGASGYVGRALARRLGVERIVATCHTNTFPDAIRFDGRTMSIHDLGADLSMVRYGIILFAEARVDRCAADPSGTSEVNLDATRRVIDQLIERGTTPVFFSTDLVFDGVVGRYREDSSPNPVVTYGNQKLAIERYLQSTGENFLIIRLAKALSEDLNYGGLLTEWSNSLRTGRRILCAEDQNCSFIDIQDVVTALIKLMKDDASGLFHLGGPDSLSRLELFEMFAGCLPQCEGAREQILRCGINDVPGLLERRPINISLDSTKLYETIDFVPKPMEAVCRQAAKLLASG